MSTPQPPRPPGPGQGWDAVGQRFAGPPPPPGAPPPAPRCGVCGAPLASDQTYCMECGSPTSLAPTPSRPPRGTALVAAAVALLAVGTGALAYAVAADDEDTRTVTAAGTPVATAPAATGPLPPDTSAGAVAPPAGTFPTVTSGVATAPAPAPTTTSPGGATPPVTTSAEDPDDVPAGGVPGLPGFDPNAIDPVAPADEPGGEGDGAGVPPPTQSDPVAGPGVDGEGSDWPAGRTGWTVQAASARTRPEAEAVEDRLRAAGEPAGVLISSDHPGLRPGYYVAFSGVRASREEAIAAARDLRAAGFPRAFARRITS